MKQIFKYFEKLTKGIRCIYHEIVLLEIDIHQSFLKFHFQSQNFYIFKK